MKLWIFKYWNSEHIWIDGGPLETQRYIFLNNVEKVLLHLDQYWRKKHCKIDGSQTWSWPKWQLVKVKHYRENIGNISTHLLQVISSATGWQPKNATEKFPVTCTRHMFECKLPSFDNTHFTAHLLYFKWTFKLLDKWIPIKANKKPL